MVIIARPITTFKPTGTNTLFSLHTIHKKKETTILMQLFTKDMHTGRLTKTLPMLNTYLPSILQSTCFNEANQPFSLEVLRTEIGHLFEHILLEYLCQLKLAKGHAEASFSGTTDWNWNTDPRGTFWITISVGAVDQDIFPEALQRSKELLTYILQSHNTPSFSQKKIQHLFSPLSKSLS